MWSVCAWRPWLEPVAGLGWGQVGGALPQGLPVGQLELQQAWVRGGFWGTLCWGFPMETAKAGAELGWGCWGASCLGRLGEMATAG